MDAIPSVPLDFEPRNVEELTYACQDWHWRVYSGFLYKIMTKDDEFDTNSVVPFRPNEHQDKFIRRLHYRNTILKARQLGFSTLTAILWFDHALFVPNQRCGIIAQSLEVAEEIFRDKIVFAYDNLPDYLRAAFPVKKQTTSQILFGHNNSMIRVATSLRGGTYHRVHISEMGKIGAKFPQKAVEIVTGTLPAVPLNGIAVVESTSEGASGEFFNMTNRAERRAKIKRPLSPKEFRFHFYPWHDAKEYCVPEDDPTIVSALDHKYFDEVEREMNVSLSLGQRKWYIGTRDNEFSGDPEKMWREYPSMPKECWQASLEGTYFGKQMSAARGHGRIGKYPHVKHVPVHTFWDIGATDGTAIWCMQQVGINHYFPLFIEGWGEGYDFYIKALKDTGWLFGTHFLPHDAENLRQMQSGLSTPKLELEQLAPEWTFQTVPRVTELIQGIAMTRQQFHLYHFDEEGCKEGIAHLESYRKRWSSRVGAFIESPEKDTGHSEAADALRQMAQGYDASLVGAPDPYDTLAKARAGR